MNNLLVDTITPLNSTTISIHDVAISGIAPTTDQILTATSPTTAEWQSGIGALATTTNAVDISGSAPPASGQIFITNSPTSAVWQTKTTFAKAPVRASTTTNGTLASDFENGDTIDGIILSTGDRILIKDQTVQTENGIYTVNASGAPTRAIDLQTGDDASNVITIVQEGTINAQIGFTCTASPAIVDTDNLTFEIYTNIPSGYSENNTIANIIDVANDGSRYIRIPPGTFVLSGTLSLANNTTIEGAGEATIIQFAGTVLSISAQTDITIKNMSIESTGGSGIAIDVVGATNRTVIENCNIIGSTINDDSTSSGTVVRKCRLDNTGARIIFAGSLNIIDSCSFNASSFTLGITSSSTADNLIITNCVQLGSSFSSLGGNSTVLCNNILNIFETTGTSNRLVFANNIFPVGIANGVGTESVNIIQGNILDDVYDTQNNNPNGIIINSNRFTDTTNQQIILNTAGTQYTLGAMIENNLFEDASGSFVPTSFSYTRNFNQFYTGVDIDRLRTISTNDSVSTTVESLFSYLEVTTTGASLNQLLISTGNFGPLANSGHWFIIERSAGPTEDLEITYSEDSSGSTTHTITSVGGFACFEFTGDFTTLRATG